MVSTVASSYTNASISRIAAHANQRDVEADPNLRDMVLGCYGQRRRNGNAAGPFLNHGVGGRPLRFLVQQHHATRGAWSEKLKLHAWLYLRRHEPQHIVDAVRFANRDVGEAKGQGKNSGKYGGKFHCGSLGAVPSGALSQMGPLEQKELLECLKENPIYHAVIRGNDPVLMPPNTRGQDVVTNYFVTGMSEMVEMFLEKLEDMFGAEEFGEMPVEAFRSLMVDQGFVQLLEEYFKMGDQHTERNLKLVGRLKGSGCLLHRAIKENHVEVVRELLDLYAHGCDGVSDRPWLRLAEPFLPMGRYHLSAFHRAVYDGRPDCLRLLVYYAQRSGRFGELRQLRNLEDRKWQQEHDGVQGMTVLELAESMGNFKCYNVLAPFLGVESVGSGHDGNGTAVDSKPREAAFADVMMPRVEVTVLHGQRAKSVETIALPDDGRVSWSGLAEILAAEVPTCLHRAMASTDFNNEIGGVGAGGVPPTSPPAGEAAAAGGDGSLASTSSSTTQGQKQTARLVDVIVHHAEITGDLEGEEEAAALLAEVPKACAAYQSFPGGSGASEAASKRPVELYRFAFRACCVQADVPTTVLSFLRALSGSGPEPPFEGQVRSAFGFMPWLRRRSRKTDAVSPAEPHGNGDQERLPTDVAANSSAATELLAQYYRRTVFEGHPAVNTDFYFAGKLIMNRVLPDSVKWLWTAAQHGKAPEMFLLKHYRRIMLQRVPSEAVPPSTGGADDLIATAGGLHGGMAHVLDQDEADEYRVSLSLLPHAMSVYKVFWDMSRLIFEKPDNPADNLEPRAVFYVEFMLRAWFAGFRDAESKDGAAREATGSSWAEGWRAQFVKYSAMQVEELDEGVFQQCCALLQPAMDKAVSSLLRMDGVLNCAFLKIKADPDTFFEAAPGTAIGTLLQNSTVRDHENFVVWMQALMPAAMGAHLNLTCQQFEKLRKYY